MGGWIRCTGPKEHRHEMKLHDAALTLAKGRQLGNCPRPECKKPLQWVYWFEFANLPKEEKDRDFEVIRVARLFHTPPDGYDPFLLLLRDVDNHRNVQVWPIFWAPGEKGRLRGGQFPPLLSRKQWEALFRKLDA